MPNLKKAEKTAKAILKNEKKARNEDRNKRVKQYIELKMLKGHSLEDASRMARGVIDNQ